jgi:hypothetical protein
VVGGDDAGRRLQAHGDEAPRLAAGDELDVVVGEQRGDAPRRRGPEQLEGRGLRRD